MAGIDFTATADYEMCSTSFPETPHGKQLQQSVKALLPMQIDVPRLSFKISG